jgi:hypothetical protein
MHLRGLSALVIGILVGMHPSAHADPRTVVNQLMTTPVSELSFGLLRLELQFERYARSDLTSVDYDPHRGRIVVENKYLREPAVTQANCGTVINRIRSFGGVDARTGKPLLDHSFFADAFRSLGGGKNSLPDDYLNQIDQIIELRVSLHADDEGTVTCRGDLLSTRISFEASPPGDHSAARAPRRDANPQPHHG